MWEPQLRCWAGPGTGRGRRLTAAALPLPLHCRAALHPQVARVWSSAPQPLRTPGDGCSPTRGVSDPVTWGPHPGPSAHNGDTRIQGVDRVSTDALPEGEVRGGWTQMEARPCSPTSRRLGPFVIFRCAPGSSPALPGPSSPPSAVLPWMRVPERRRRALGPLAESLTPLPAAPFTPHRRSSGAMSPPPPPASFFSPAAAALVDAPAQAPGRVRARTLCPSWRTGLLVASSLKDGECLDLWEGVGKGWGQH